MRLTNQAPPVPRRGVASAGPDLEKGVRPADCTDGTLYVIAPDNPVPYTFPKAVGCCYSYPNCNPCHDNAGNKSFVQQHVAACAGDAISSCFWWQTC